MAMAIAMEIETSLMLDCVRCIGSDLQVSVDREGRLRPGVGEMRNLAMPHVKPCGFALDVWLFWTLNIVFGHTWKNVVRAGMSG